MNEILFRKFSRSPREIEEERHILGLKSLREYFAEWEIKERGYRKEILFRNFKDGGHYWYNTLPF